MGDESGNTAMEDEKADDSDIDSDFEFDEEIKQSLDHLLTIPIQFDESSDENEEETKKDGDGNNEKIKSRGNSVERKSESLDPNKEEVSKDMLGKDTGLESISENEFDGPESGECDTSDGELPDSPTIVVTLPDSPPRLPSRESFVRELDRVSADEESDLDLEDEYQNRSEEYFETLNQKILLTKPDREVIISSSHSDKSSKGKEKKEKEQKKEKNSDKKKDKKAKKKSSTDKDELKKKKLKKYLARLDQYKAKCLEYMSQISGKCDIIRKNESKKIQLEKDRIKSLLGSEKLKSAVRKGGRTSESSSNSTGNSTDILHSSRLGKHIDEEDSEMHNAKGLELKSKYKKTKRSKSREVEEQQLQYQKYILYLQAEREKCYEESKVLDKHKHKAKRKHIRKSFSPDKSKDKQLSTNRPPVMSFSQFCSSRELISPDREPSVKPIRSHSTETPSFKHKRTSLDSESTVICGELAANKPCDDEDKDLFVTYSELVEKDKKESHQDETVDETEEEEKDPEMKSISVFTSVLFKGSTDGSGIPFIQEGRPPSPMVMELVKPKPKFAPSNDLDELYDCNDEFSSISQSSFSPSRSPIPKIHNKALLNFVENQKERLDRKNDKAPQHSSRLNRSRSKSPRRERTRARMIKRKTKHNSSISVSPSPPPLRCRSPDSYRKKTSPLAHLKDRWRDYPLQVERRREYYEKSKVRKRSRSRGPRGRAGHRSRSSSEERYYRHYRSRSRSRSRSPPTLSPVMVQISPAEKRRRLKEEHERALASLRATMRKSSPLEKSPLSITFKTDGNRDNYEPVLMNEDSSSLSGEEVSPVTPTVPPLPPGLPPEPPPAPHLTSNDKKEPAALLTTYTSFVPLPTLGFVNNEMTQFNNWMTPNVPPVADVGHSMSHMYPGPQLLNNYDQFNTPPPQPFPFLNQPPPPLPYQMQVPPPCHQHYRMPNQGPPQNINLINVHQEIKTVKQNSLVIAKMQDNLDYLSNNMIETNKCKHNPLGQNNQTVQEAIDSVKKCLQNCDSNKVKDPRLISVHNRSKSPETKDQKHSSNDTTNQNDTSLITLNYKPKPISLAKDVNVFSQEPNLFGTDPNLESELRHYAVKEDNTESYVSKMKDTVTENNEIRENNAIGKMQAYNNNKHKKNVGSDPYNPFDNENDDDEKQIEMTKRSHFRTNNFQPQNTVKTRLSSNEVENINHHIGESFSFIFSHTIERRRLTPTVASIEAKKTESQNKYTTDKHMSSYEQVIVNSKGQHCFEKQPFDEMAMQQSQRKLTGLYLKECTPPSQRGEKCVLNEGFTTVNCALVQSIDEINKNTETSQISSKHQSDVVPLVTEELSKNCKIDSETSLKVGVELLVADVSGTGNLTKFANSNMLKDSKSSKMLNRHSPDDLPISETRKARGACTLVKNDESNVSYSSEECGKIGSDSNSPKHSQTEGDQIINSNDDNLNQNIENLNPIKSNEKLVHDKTNRGIFERRGTPSLSIPTKGELKRFPTPERCLPALGKVEPQENSNFSPSLSGTAMPLEITNKTEEIEINIHADLLNKNTSVVDSILNDFEDSNSTGSGSQDTKECKSKISNDKKTNIPLISEESKTSRFIKPAVIVSSSSIDTNSKNHNVNAEKKICKTTAKLEETHCIEDKFKAAQIKLDSNNQNITENQNIENENKTPYQTDTERSISPTDLDTHNLKSSRKEKSCPLSKKHDSYISKNLPSSFDLSIDGQLIKKGFKKLQVTVEKIKESSRDSYADEDNSTMEDSSYSVNMDKEDQVPESSMYINHSDCNETDLKEITVCKKPKKRVSFDMNVNEINGSLATPGLKNVEIEGFSEDVQGLNIKDNLACTSIEDLSCNTETSKILELSEITKHEDPQHYKSNSPKKLADLSTYYKSIFQTLQKFYFSPPQLQHRKSLIISIPTLEDMPEAKVKETPKRGINSKNKGKFGPSSLQKELVQPESNPRNKLDEKHSVRQKSAISGNSMEESCSNYCKNQDKEPDNEDSFVLDRELSDLAKGCLDSDDDSVLNFGIVPSDESSEDNDFTQRWKNGSVKVSRQSNKIVKEIKNAKKNHSKKNRYVYDVPSINTENNKVKQLANDFSAELAKESTSQDNSYAISKDETHDEKVKEKDNAYEGYLKPVGQSKESKTKRGRPKKNKEDPSKSTMNNFISREQKHLMVNEDFKECSFMTFDSQENKKNSDEQLGLNEEKCVSSEDPSVRNVQDMLKSTSKTLKTQCDMIEKVNTDIMRSEYDKSNEKELDGTGILYGGIVEKVEKIDKVEDKNTSDLRKVRKLKNDGTTTKVKNDIFISKNDISIHNADEIESKDVKVGGVDKKEEFNISTVSIGKNVEIVKVDEVETVNNLNLRRTSKRKCTETKDKEDTSIDRAPDYIGFEKTLKKTRNRKMAEDNMNSKNYNLIPELKSEEVRTIEVLEESKSNDTLKLRKVRKGRPGKNNNPLPSSASEKLLRDEEKIAEETPVSSNTLNVPVSKERDDKIYKNTNGGSTLDANIDPIESFPKMSPRSNKEEDTSVEVASLLLSTRQTRSSCRLKTETKGNKSTHDTSHKNDLMEILKFSDENNTDVLENNFKKLEDLKQKFDNIEDFTTPNLNSSAKNDEENDTSVEKEAQKSDASIHKFKNKIETKLCSENTIFDNIGSSEDIKKKTKTCVSENTSENLNNVKENQGGKSKDNSDLRSKDSSDIPNDSKSSEGFNDQNSNNDADINTQQKINIPFDMQSQKKATPETSIEKHFGLPIGIEITMSPVTSRNASNPKIKEALRKKRDKAEVDAEIKRRLAEIDELEKLARSQHVSLLGKIGSRKRSKMETANQDKSADEFDDIVSISSDDSNTTSVDTIDTRMTSNTVGEISKTEESTNDEPTTTLAERTNKLEMNEMSPKDDINLTKFSQISMFPVSSPPKQKCVQPLEGISSGIFHSADALNLRLNNDKRKYIESDQSQSSNLNITDFHNDSQLVNKAHNKKKGMAQKSNTANFNKTAQMLGEPVKRARRNVASVYQFRDDENESDIKLDIHKKFQLNRQIRNRQSALLRKEVNASDKKSINKPLSEPINLDKHATNILPEPDSSTPSLTNVHSSKVSEELLLPMTNSKSKNLKEDQAVQDDIIIESSVSTLLSEPQKKSKKPQKSQAFIGKNLSVFDQNIELTDDSDVMKDIGDTVDEQSEEAVSSSVTNIPNETLTQMKKRRKRKTCVDLLMEDSMLSVTRDILMSPNPYNVSTINKELDSIANNKITHKNATADPIPRKKHQSLELTTKPDVLAQKLKLIEKLKCINRKNRKTRQCRTLVCYNEDSLPESLVESPVSESNLTNNENVSVSQESIDEKQEITSELSLLDDSSFLPDNLPKRTKRSSKTDLKRKQNVSSRAKVNKSQGKIKKREVLMKKKVSSEHEHEDKLDINESKSNDVPLKQNENVEEKPSIETEKIQEPSEFDKLLLGNTTSNLCYDCEPSSPKNEEDDKSNDVSDDFFDCFPSPLQSDSDFESLEDKINKDDKKPTNVFLCPEKIVCSILKSKIGKMLPYFGDSTSDDSADDDDVPLSIKLSKTLRAPSRKNTAKQKSEYLQNTPQCFLRGKGRKLKLDKTDSKDNNVQKDINKTSEDNSFTEQETTSNDYIEPSTEQVILDKTSKLPTSPLIRKSTRKTRSFDVSYNESDQHSDNILFERTVPEDHDADKLSGDIPGKSDIGLENISLRRRGRPAKTKAALKENLTEDLITAHVSRNRTNSSKNLEKSANLQLEDSENMGLRKRKMRNINIVSDDISFAKVTTSTLESANTAQQPVTTVDFNNLNLSHTEKCELNEESDHRMNDVNKNVSQCSTDICETVVSDDKGINSKECSKNELLIQDDLEVSKKEENKTLQFISPSSSKDIVDNKNTNPSAGYVHHANIYESNSVENSFDEPPPLIKPRARRAKTRAMDNIYLDPPNLDTFSSDDKLNEMTVLQKETSVDTTSQEIDQVLPSKKRGRKPRRVLEIESKMIVENELEEEFNERSNTIGVTSKQTGLNENNEYALNKPVLRKLHRNNKRKVTLKRVVKTCSSTKKQLHKCGPDLKANLSTEKNTDKAMEVPQHSISIDDQMKNSDTNQASISNLDNSFHDTVSEDQPNQIDSNKAKPNIEENKDVLKTSDTNKLDTGDESKQLKEHSGTEKEIQDNEKPSRSDDFSDSPRPSNCSNQSFLWNKISTFLNKSTRSVGTQVKIKNMVLKGFDTSEPVVSLQSELTLPHVIKSLFEELKTLDSSFSDP